MIVLLVESLSKAGGLQMELPTCTECNHPISWKKTYKSIYIRKNINCKRCGTQLKPSNIRSLSLIIIIPMVLSNWIFDSIIFTGNLDLQFFIVLSIIIGIAHIVSLFLPYLVKYKKCEL